MYPKYFLADVPHELRTRVLDRCFRRLWHEALDLLRQNNIYHYNRDDLINFYSWAPSTLPQPPTPPVPSPPNPDPILTQCTPPSPGSAGILPALPAEQAPLELPSAPQTTHHAPRTTDNPRQALNSEPKISDPQPAPVEPLPPETTPPIVKRRGKIASLPKDIRERVNLMLDEGVTSKRIIEWLGQNGFPAVNKVNLHKWYYGGFQDWSREQERIENQSIQREWLRDTITRSQPGDLHHCIYTLFASQIMDSLFGMDTAKLKSGLAAKPRDYIALMNGFRRLDKQLTEAPELQPFLPRKRAPKKAAAASLPKPLASVMNSKKKLSLVNLS